MVKKRLQLRSKKGVKLRLKGGREILLSGQKLEPLFGNHH